MINKIVSILKFGFIELLIIWILILSINNYFGNKHSTISADGIGYYEYLPSLFIYGDLIRKDSVKHENHVYFNRIDSIAPGIYVDYNEYKVNKYPCGTAILISPFFFGAYISSTHTNSLQEGYSYPYQKAVFCAALFYLFLSLLLLKKLLQLYAISSLNIFFSQLLLVLSTSVIHYTYNEAAFSHIYSLFAISAFMYFARAYFINKKINHFISACAFLGLIFLLRNINVLIVLILPFLAGSPENLKSGVAALLKKPVHVFKGVFLFLAIIFIQCLLWYLQTNVFFLYSYQKEGFNFLNPAFADILFSYRKGLFVYSPIIFIAMLGSIKLVYEHKYYLFLSGMSFFVILTYFLSSWWCWYYGCSYGQRAYIEFYPFFFILFAMLLQELNIWIKIIVIIVSVGTIPLNFIQTHQYKEGILDWVNMDKRKYWQIFLKDSERFNWAIWKRKYDLNLYQLVDEKTVGDITVPANTKNLLIYEIAEKSIDRFEQVQMIQVSFDNEFSSDEDSRIDLNCIDTIKNTKLFHDEKPIIHFAEKGYDFLQTGLFNYDLIPTKDLDGKKVTISIHAGNKNLVLRNLRVKFFAKK